MELLQGQKLLILLEATLLRAGSGAAAALCLFYFFNEDVSSHCINIRPMPCKTLVHPSCTPPPPFFSQQQHMSHSSTGAENSPQCQPAAGCGCTLLELWRCRLGFKPRQFGKADRTREGEKPCREHKRGKRDQKKQCCCFSNEARCTPTPLLSSPWGSRGLVNSPGTISARAAL